MEAKILLDLLDLRVFTAVVEEGSLSAAGRELDISVPVVSKRLTKLEEQLGTRLIQRTTRQLMLTEVGEGFYERVKVALDAATDAYSYASASGVPAGLLRVSAPTGFGRRHIVPRIDAFLAEYPDIQLKLDLSDDFVDLISDGYDVALRIGCLEDSSFIARRLAKNRRFLCATPAYLERFGFPESLEDLRDHRLLTTTAQREWLLEGPEGKITYVPDQFIQTNSSEVVRGCMLDSMGIALRSTWDTSEELKSGTLCRVLEQYSGLHDVSIFALYPSRRQVAPKVRAFIDYFSRRFGPEPYWDEGL